MKKSRKEIFPKELVNEMWLKNEAIEFVDGLLALGFGVELVATAGHVGYSVDFQTERDARRGLKCRDLADLMNIAIESISSEE